MYYIHMSRQKLLNPVHLFSGPGILIMIAQPDNQFREIISLDAGKAPCAGI